jgi:hypothetical protein
MEALRATIGWRHGFFIKSIRVVFRTAMARGGRLLITRALLHCAFLGDRRVAIAILRFPMEDFG